MYCNEISSEAGKRMPLYGFTAIL